MDKRLIVLIFLVIIIIILGFNSKNSETFVTSGKQDDYSVEIKDNITGHYRHDKDSVDIYRVSDNKIVYKNNKDSKYKLLVLSKDNYYTGDVSIQIKNNKLLLDNVEYKFINDITSTSVFNVLYGSIGFNNDSLCNGYFIKDNYAIYLVSQFNSDKSETCNVYISNSSSAWYKSVLNSNNINLFEQGVRIEVFDKKVIATFNNDTSLSGTYKKKSDMDISAAILLKVQTM